ncbi:M20 family metallo-hydrolase [Pontibacter sp. SGAir0037]|uniref:M20 family metallo-hydrolase n=1 Tax=Pontibacter sp. SGAir0037 TaxID=2571030 RepID=UPI0010CD46EB|nr:M20 family metallo-hydrolase [Pontibacter sp. SGAir0037]QCR21967.1 acetylornithine deacetylase [Pontibacter sp. SGAir0037]
MPDHTTQLHFLYEEALNLLKKLISIQSFSREEDKTADAIFTFLEKHEVKAHRHLNNVWAFNKYYNPSLPTILLNSHHDTVKPNPGWTLNPLEPLEQEGKLYGLGSNDAGGCLTSLIAAFLYFYPQQALKYNFVLAATAEEEVSGTSGLELVLPQLGDIDFAIVGEPTQMHLAVAEKGLLVLDCEAKGKSGHAAREEGVNAIYEALQDINWFRHYQFNKISETLGPIKMSVTVIQAGTQHNVVPDTCKFTVDVRVTDAYTLEEVLQVIRENVKADVTPRSVRLQPSSIPVDHAIVQAGLNLGRYTYGSPTTSDQALLRVPSLKLGPGDSARSHTADEFIYLHEIKEGIQLYIQMLEKIAF